MNKKKVSVREEEVQNIEKKKLHAFTWVLQMLFQWQMSAKQFQEHSWKLKDILQPSEFK